MQVASHDSAHSKFEKVTIGDGSRILIEFYDDKEYAQRIGTIMESWGVKEELGETILWGHVVQSRRFFKVKTKELWIITNHRVMHVNNEIEDVIQLPLKYVDVVVMNARNDHYSEGVGAFVGVLASISSGMGFLQRRGTSRRIGDLVFLLNGQILIRFFNVFDPTGVKQLIYQVKRQLYGNTK